ncbi:MAG: prephenate dehydrogenase/arogenate dehydrogenase family protein, partial [Deltaproteobacteria bacterium]|nr:prephenate dehydrogenase/arogenate dehydrogenase family protein [Deltaproteobacteria bacterium]
FGPSERSLNGQGIVFCPARIDRWASWPRDLFAGRGARIIEASAAQHDEIMSLVQALTHLSTMLTGLALAGSAYPRETLETFATPRFMERLEAVDRVFGENPRLYAEIVAANPGTAHIIASLEKNLEILKDFIVRGDAAGIADLLRNKHKEYFLQ